MYGPFLGRGSTFQTLTESGTTSDEEVIEWDYIDHLLDNLASLRKDIRIQREARVSFSSIDEIDEYSSSLHYFEEVSFYVSIGKQLIPYFHELQVNYRVISQPKLCSPYIQKTHFQKFLLTLNSIFCKETVDAILRTPIYISLSEIPNDIVPIDYKAYYPRNKIRQGLRKLNRTFYEIRSQLS